MSFNDTLKHLEACDKLLEQAKELCEQGSLDRAEDLCHEVLQEFVELYGANSLKTTTCLLVLVDVNYNQRNYADVITSIQQVLVVDAGQNFLSDDQAMSLHFKLAKSLEKTGNYQDAVNRYRELWTVVRETLGSSAPYTMRVASSLRSLLERHGSVIANSELLLDEITAQFPEAVRSSIPTSYGMLSRLAPPAPRLCPFLPPGSIACFAEGSEWGLSLAAASVLCFWFLLSGVVDEKTTREKKGAVATAANSSVLPGTLSMYQGVYVSTDGSRSLVIDDGETGKYSSPTNVESFKLKQLGSELYAKTDRDHRMIFRTSGQHLVDEDGVKLFRSGSPELSTIGSMKEIGEALNTFYRMRGRYPGRQGEFRALGRRLRFVNAVNSRPSEPRFKSVGGKLNSVMTVEDYTQQTTMQAALMSGNAHGTPGSVEVFAFPLTNSGGTMIVRGYDRNGDLLPSSVPGKCFALSLSGGVIR